MTSRPGRTAYRISVLLAVAVTCLALAVALTGTPTERTHDMPLPTWMNGHPGAPQPQPTHPAW
ncbi:hypothetical protein PV724_45460, partial [Streptomyces europaeiscabiei]|uniref:hypothetical protein n=1 Tax=Streptomyces europaeiscabiei TaxID=146819 RepID=UPI0029A64DF7